ncbi:hypothetical protein MTBLM1_110010 [Rhodospirillaceae bacterium LM-1]|nr:hypothetical protein MTBLM1_110010 [Rhodospirillaceae bacterium LM-1]
MTHLIVDCQTHDFDWSGASGLLAHAADLKPQTAVGHELLLLRGSPQTSPEWAGQPNVLWLAEQGLEQAARLRDLFPGERVLACATASRPSSYYLMGKHYTGDGFSYYVPDMSTYKAYRIAEGDEYLSDWLPRATSLGFDEILFEAPDARAEEKGFDLELLEKIKRNYAGRILLSGGATEFVHFERLVKEGGCFAALVSQACALKLGIQKIADLLNPPPEETSPPETEGEAA